MEGFPRIIFPKNVHEARREMAAIGCDVKGIGIMQEKMLFKVIKIEGIIAKNANLLKQTFLAKGGEVAVGRGVADMSVEKTDVIICATVKQYRKAIAQLKEQPWGLPRIAASLEELLRREENIIHRHYYLGRKELTIESKKTLVMGILNITPDSFSDGGRYENVAAALQQMKDLCDAGADIIDIGAESTRPYNGGKPISAKEELERLLPVLEPIIKACPLPISVDTYKPEVAEKALAMGADMINDVWGLQHDADMAAVVAKHRVPVVVMHNRAASEEKTDIMKALLDFFAESITIADQAGIARDKIIIDPGIGFGKTTAQNLEIVSRLDELKILGMPILLGTSRKRFIGEVLELPVDERIEGTGATVACGMMKGANIVRVHDVKEIVRTVRMTEAIIRGKKDEQ